MPEKSKRYHIEVTVVPNSNVATYWPGPGDVARFVENVTRSKGDFWEITGVYGYADDHPPVLIDGSELEAIRHRLEEVFGEPIPDRASTTEAVNVLIQKYDMMKNLWVRARESSLLESEIEAQLREWTNGCTSP